MTTLRDALLEIHSLLGRCGIRHCLVGGFATAIHGVPRSTNDIDFLVHGRALAKKQDALMALCRESGYEIVLAKADVEDPLGDVIRLLKGPVVVDLIAARFDYEHRSLERAQPLPLFGHTIPVVNATDLIVLKLRAGGPQDLYDVAGVLAVSGHYLDLADIERLAARIGVLDKWALAQGLAKEALPTQPPPVADQPDKPPHLPPQNGS